MRGAARCSCRGRTRRCTGLAHPPHAVRAQRPSGLLQLRDYSEQRLLLMRMFDKLLGHCLAFSPNGKLLAAGFTNGTVKLLAGMTLEEIATFRVSRECITQVCGMGIRRPHHQPPPPPPPSLPSPHPSPLHPHLRSPSRTTHPTRHRRRRPLHRHLPPRRGSTSPPPPAPSVREYAGKETTAATSNCAASAVPLTPHPHTTPIVTTVPHRRSGTAPTTALSRRSPSASPPTTSPASSLSVKTATWWSTTKRSSVTGGKLLRSGEDRAGAVPTACMWPGRMKEPAEPIVVTAKSQARIRRPHATRPHSSHKHAALTPSHPHRRPQYKLRVV